jgi:hypothetical protein
MLSFLEILSDDSIGMLTFCYTVLGWQPVVVIIS